MKYLDSATEAADAVAKAERWHGRLAILILVIVLELIALWII